MFKLLDISKIKDSAYTIYLMAKNVTKKVSWAIYRPDEKSLKNTGKLELNFPQMTMVTAPKYKLCLIFRTCPKKLVEFTDSTHTIYWSPKKA